MAGKTYLGGPNENINVLRNFEIIFYKTYRTIWRVWKKMMNDYQKDLVVPFFDSNI